MITIIIINNKNNKSESKGRKKKKKKKRGTRDWRCRGALLVVFVTGMFSLTPTNLFSVATDASVPPIVLAREECGSKFA